MYECGPSEYDKMRNWCIPLGWHGDGQDKKVWTLTLPMGESERSLLLALKIALGQGIATIKSDEVEQARLHDMAQFMAGDLPGGNPVVDLLQDWLIYAGGGNPYDTFRNRPAMTDDEQKIGGLIGLKAMAWHSANKFVSSMTGRLGPETVGEPKRTLGENIIYRTPILRGFVKITNAGFQERLRRQAEPFSVAQARIREEQDAMVIRLRRQGRLNEEGLRHGLTNEELTKLQAGMAIQAQYPNATLSPEDEVRRYYYTHFIERLKTAGIRDLSPGAQQIIRQPSRATKAAVMRELMQKR
jgi:hypothetical protein